MVQNVENNKDVPLRTFSVPFQQFQSFLGQVQVQSGSHESTNIDRDSIIFSPKS